MTRVKSSLYKQNIKYIKEKEKEWVRHLKVEDYKDDEYSHN